MSFLLVNIKSKMFKSEPAHYIVEITFEKKKDCKRMTKNIWNESNLREEKTPP